MTPDEIRAKYIDVGRSTLHGTPPGDWFRWWMEDVGTLLHAIAEAEARARTEELRDIVVEATLRQAMCKNGLRAIAETAMRSFKEWLVARAGESILHYSVQPFTPVCGADVPNQRTTQIDVRATCVPCLWKLLGIIEARARAEERAPMIGWAAALVCSIVGVDDDCAEPVRLVAMQIRDWHDRARGEA